MEKWLKQMIKEAFLEALEEMDKTGDIDSIQEAISQMLKQPAGEINEA